MTNLWVGLVGARELAVREFGAVSLVFAIYVVCLGISRTLSSQPLAIQHANERSGPLRRAISASSGASLLFGLAVGCCCAGVGLILSGPPGTAAIALGVCLPGLLVQDSWRYAFFVTGRQRSAAGNDLVWLLLLIAAFLMVHPGQVTATSLVLVWGVCGNLAAVVGALQIGSIPRPSRAGTWLGANRRTVAPLLGEFALVGASHQIVFFLIAATTGVAAVSVLRAGQLLVGPAMVMVMASHLFIQLEAMKAVEKNALDEFIRVTSAVLIAGVLTWGAIAMLIPEHVGRSLLGNAWPGAKSVLLPCILTAGAYAVTTSPVAGIRALQLMGRSLQIRVAATTIILTLVVVGSAAADTRGAAWGLAMGGWLAAVMWWTGYIRARPARIATLTEATCAS